MGTAKERLEELERERQELLTEIDRQARDPAGATNATDTTAGTTDAAAATDSSKRLEDLESTVERLEATVAILLEIVDTFVRRPGVYEAGHVDALELLAEDYDERVGKGARRALIDAARREIQTRQIKANAQR